jgi:hypothetical protein
MKIATVSRVGPRPRAYNHRERKRVKELATLMLAFEPLNVDFGDMQLKLSSDLLSNFRLM